MSNFVFDQLFTRKVENDDNLQKLLDDNEILMRGNMTLDLDATGRIRFKNRKDVSNAKLPSDINISRFFNFKEKVI